MDNQGKKLSLGKVIAFILAAAIAVSGFALFVNADSWQASDPDQKIAAETIAPGSEYTFLNYKNASGAETAYKIPYKYVQNTETPVYCIEHTLNEPHGDEYELVGNADEVIARILSSTLLGYNDEQVYYIKSLAIAYYYYKYAEPKQPERYGSIELLEQTMENNLVTISEEQKQMWQDIKDLAQKAYTGEIGISENKISFVNEDEGKKIDFEFDYENKYYQSSDFYKLNIKGSPTSLKITIDNLPTDMLVVDENGTVLDPENLTDSTPFKLQMPFSSIATAADFESAIEKIKITAEATFNAYGALEYKTNSSGVQDIAIFIPGVETKNTETTVGIRNALNARIKVIKTDNADKTVVLSDVVFEIRDSNGNIVVPSFTTDSNGEALTPVLQEGSYQLIELIPRPGYEPLTGPVDFTIDHNQDYILLDATPVMAIDVTNYQTPTGKVTLKKTDSENPETILPGAVFELYKVADEGSEDELIGKYTTNDAGIIEKDDLVYGDYYFLEVEVPEGYELVGDGKYSFTIDATNTEVVIEATNEKVPETPSTPGNPKTGDTVPIIPAICIITGLFAFVLLKKRNIR